ncbi:MAG: hypothetical protein IIX15_01150 [Clostridia bacterium]|jgi:hypothetical protein|nr:hypothetical protein [Clostridia bacterium]
MLKIERVSVMNLENAMRGARNPMNSWAKSDSYYDEKGNYVLGENDIDLAKRLARAGSDHRKFIRQIFVSVDITAPLYWWKEFDTYKVGTVANSTSTMHKIHSKPFEREDFSCDRLDEGGLAMLDTLISYLEGEREKFNANREDRQSWHNMIQMLPSSYNQMRTVTMNYENLVNIYYARKSHKLAEWHVLCDWIKALPYAEALILVKD